MTKQRHDMGSVLIVDDTPVNLRLVADLLRGSGFEARPVPSGEMALRAAAHDPPDLILLDVRMPGMDGFEVCAALQADPGLRDIPIVFLSASDDQPDIARAVRAGAVDFVTKPIDVARLMVLIRTYVRLRRLESALRDIRAAIDSDLSDYDVRASVRALLDELLPREEGQP